MDARDGHSEPPPPIAPEGPSRSLWFRLAKGLLHLAGALALAMGALFGLIYLKLGPGRMPMSEVSRFIDLEPGDEVLHAYYGVRWLDSQRYFVIRPPRERLEREFKGVEPPTDEDYVDVFSGARVRGKRVPTPGESLPAWWDVAELNDVVVRDIRTSGGHNGEMRIYSLEKGLIYVLDR